MANESEQDLGEDFYRNKQATARAYIDLVLPQVLAYHEQVLGSAAAIMDYPLSALSV